MKQTGVLLSERKNDERLEKKVKIKEEYTKFDTEMGTKARDVDTIRLSGAHSFIQKV